MKYCIVPLAFLVLFTACTEDDPAPVQTAPDSFIGKWNYDNSAIPLVISFEVTKGATSDSEYAFKNISIEHPDIPENAQLTYGMEVFDKFADGDGFGMIKIHGGNETFWIFIILTYNSIHRQGLPYVMDVSEMEIRSINKGPVTITGQRFNRIN